MKVKCIKNRGGEVSENVRRVFGLLSDEAMFSAEVGKEYTVLGIVMKKGLLGYIIYNAPVISIEPQEIFAVLVSQLSENWFFNGSPSHDLKHQMEIDAVWGDYELCFKENYLISLMEMDEKSVHHFLSKNSKILKIEDI